MFVLVWFGVVVIEVVGVGDSSIIGVIVLKLKILVIVLLILKRRLMMEGDWVIY